MIAVLLCRLSVKLITVLSLFVLGGESSFESACSCRRYKTQVNRMRGLTKLCTSYKALPTVVRASVYCSFCFLFFRCFPVLLFILIPPICRFILFAHLGLRALLSSCSSSSFSSFPLPPRAPTDAHSSVDVDRPISLWLYEGCSMDILTAAAESRRTYLAPHAFSAPVPTPLPIDVDLV